MLAYKSREWINGKAISTFWVLVKFYFLFLSKLKEKKNNSSEDKENNKKKTGKKNRREAKKQVLCKYPYPSCLYPFFYIFFPWRGALFLVYSYGGIDLHKRSRKWNI